MRRFDAVRRVAFVVVVLSLLLVPAARQALDAAPGSAPVPQWHLDIERAMDAIGVASGMVVGEAGAGDGYFTLPLARRVGPTGVVLANDISAHALQSLEMRGSRDGLSNIQTVLGSVADPKFPRRDLQLVVLVHALHDFSSPVEWLVNLRSYLRPGARLAVIDRDPSQGAESHFLSRERITRYANQAGYELTKGVFDVSDHLIMVFKVRESAGAPTASAAHAASSPARTRTRSRSASARCRPSP